MYLRKLGDDEQPLRLRLLAGPSEKMLSFILKENETGEVNVSAGTGRGLAPALPGAVAMGGHAGPRSRWQPLCLQWDAFTLPELHNFLLILQREEEEHVRRLRHRYARCRQKMQEALATLTPG